MKGQRREQGRVSPIPPRPCLGLDFYAEAIKGPWRILELIRGTF